MLTMSRAFSTPSLRIPLRKQEGRTMAAGVGQTNPVAKLSLLVLSSHTLKHSTLVLRFIDMLSVIPLKCISHDEYYETVINDRRRMSYVKRREVGIIL